jgi:hypothetical protein
MAHLEGAYEQINERLSELQADVHGLRADNAEIRRQIGTQFYWLLSFVLGSILVPILRDLVH